MRVDHLLIQNFKGFERQELRFHPTFNLVVGTNGAGKTSILDALSIAAGSWLLEIPGGDTRHIWQQEVRLVGRETDTGLDWAPQFPCSIEATGLVQDAQLTWSRTLNDIRRRTTYVNATNIKNAAAAAVQGVRRGSECVLPLISYYGTGRLWQAPRDQARIESAGKIEGATSRLDGYRHSVDPRLSVVELMRWIARQAWMTFQQQGKESPAALAVRTALKQSIEGARDIVFDAKLGEVIVEFTDAKRQPFNNLSDGQRCMLALVGDIAQKAATLNPHLGGDILTKTPGIVLIDELDLHLHPKWQRHVIEDLRTTFPSIQFVCTTHSPFLIQSLRSGEELVMLDGQPTAKLGHLSIEEIAKGIQGVERPDVSARYESEKAAARHYLEILEEAAMAPKEKLESYLARLAEGIGPYADNPAFQAILERKRVSKLGV